MQSNKTYKLALNAMLVALHFVLCRFAIRIPVPPTTLVFTVSGLPVALAGLLFGPYSGVIVGLLGSFINQMFLYGLSATTPLWILPTGMLGLVCGLGARWNNFELSYAKRAVIIMIGTILVTLLNIAANYVDAAIYGWNYSVVWMKSLMDLGMDVVKGFVYAFLITQVIRALERSFNLKALRETGKTGQ